MRKEFDYSMMSCFLTCRRRYDFRYNKNLVPKVATLPLHFGGAIHEALDVWHAERDVDRAVVRFHEMYKEDLERDDKRTNSMGEWILRNYAKTYAYEPFKVVENERSFELGLPNGNKFIGRIDKVVEWDKMFWVMDHKTTSSMGYAYGKRVEPNMQLTGYVWAARQLGYPKAVGVLVDAILVAKGLLQASSRARLTPLARFDSYISEQRLEEWNQTVKMIQHDIHQCTAQDVWYPNWDACTYYGECPYRKLCKEDPDVRDKLLPIDYEESVWDPRKEIVDA